MTKTLLVVLSLFVFQDAEAMLARHWQTPWAVTARLVTDGGLQSRFAVSGSDCIATDGTASITRPAAGAMYGGYAYVIPAETFPAGTAVNLGFPGLGVCRMALQYKYLSGCSAASGTRGSTCTGEVSTGGCTIHASGNQISCN